MQLDAGGQNATAHRIPASKLPECIRKADARLQTVVADGPLNPHRLQSGFCSER